LDATAPHLLSWAPLWFVVGRRKRFLVAGRTSSSHDNRQNEWSDCGTNVHIRTASKGRTARGSGTTSTYVKCSDDPGLLCVDSMVHRDSFPLKSREQRRRFVLSSTRVQRLERRGSRSGRGKPPSFSIMAPDGAGCGSTSTSAHPRANSRACDRQGQTGCGSLSGIGRTGPFAVKLFTYIAARHARSLGSCNMEDVGSCLWLWRSGALLTC
jgi:hypothetical protein